MAKQIRMYDTITKKEEFITLVGEITANGSLCLNNPLILQSSESSTLKDIKVDDSDVISAATVV